MLQYPEERIAQRHVAATRREAPGLPNLVRHTALKRLIEGYIYIIYTTVPDSYRPPHELAE